MTELATLLTDLESRWVEKGSDEYEALAPGLDRGQVVTALKANGLRAPAELIDWYSWHNGVAPEHAGSRWVRLAPSGFWQLSLQESLEERARWMQGAEEAAVVPLGDDEADELSKPSYWWEPTWLPIGMSTAPNVLVADLGGSSDSVTVLIVEWSDMDYSRQPRAGSLAAWVRILLGVPNTYWGWLPSEERTTGWVFDGELPMEFRGRF